MADKNIGIALILSAQNQASATINNFVSNTMGKLQQLQNASAKIAEGWGEMYAARKGYDLVKPTLDAYGQMEQAGNYLKANMLSKDGLLDSGVYDKLYSYSQKLSDSYTGSTASYLDMVRVMKQNRINPNEIMGGIGESSAKLAIYFDNMLPAATAEFAAHMKNDMGIASKEMYSVMDLVARVHDVGVGKTGQEAVDEMNQFFSKVGLGLANLHAQGLESSKSMGALGAIFMSKGLSGQSVGTNFRRILDGMRSFEKVKEANKVAALFHKNLQFFDKKGQFLGIDNFVAQLGKLQGMNPAAIEAILKPFAGKQGLSTDFLEFMANEGVGAFDEMKKRINNQADLNQKVGAIMNGQKKNEEVLQSTWENTKAAFGKTLSPTYVTFITLLNKASIAIRNFIDNHPKLTQFIGTLIAVGSTVAGLAGVIKMIQGISMAIRVLSIVSATNPFLLIVAAAVVAVSLIITYWDPIKTFFINLWDKIKGIWASVTGWFSRMWENVKNVFMTVVKVIAVGLLNFTPAGLIFSHWNQLAPYFTKIWEGAKRIFTGWWHWVTGWANVFANIGKKMMDMLIGGIMSKVDKVTQTIKHVTQKIRDFFPFSPAKEGPLRDIHKIKLMETISASIRPDSLVRAVEDSLQVVRNSFTHASAIPALANAGNHYSSAPQFNVTINLTGSATKADADMLTSSMKEQMDRWYRDMEQNKRRISF